MAIPQRLVYAVMVMSVLMLGAILTIPAFLAALGTGYGMTNADLGRLSAIEFLANIVGTYLTTSKSVAQLAQWVPWACALAGIANMASVFIYPQVPLIAFHPLAALGGGVVYGYVLKVAGASARQERNFGISLAMVNLSMLGEFQLIAYLSIKYKPSAIFILYAALSLIALVISVVTRLPLKNTSEAEVVHTEGKQLRGLGIVMLISVLAMGVSFTAYGIIWPFAQRLGETHGFSSISIANGLSAFAVTGILGNVAAAAITQKISRAAIFSIALCAILGSIYMLSVPTSFIWFFLGCSIFGFYWNFYFILHLGILARADITGRGTVLGGLTPNLGMVLGSFLGGMLTEGTNYLPLAWTGAALCVIGTVGTLGTIAQLKRVQPINPAVVRKIERVTP